MLYFAYGSNMDWEQIRSRCPTVRYVCMACLRDYRLAFTRKSKKRQCGVADIVPTPEEEVWGVVYQIDELDVGALDEWEGYSPRRERNAYLRVEIHVFRDGDENQPVAVVTYVVTDKESSVPPPNEEYKRLIVEGAKYWHLPDDYITKLEKIGTNT